MGTCPYILNVGNYFNTLMIMMIKLKFVLNILIKFDNAVLIYNQ